MRKPFILSQYSKTHVQDRRLSLNKGLSPSQQHLKTQNFGKGVTL